MRLLALFALVLSSVGAAETEALPSGEWRPAQVGLVQRCPVLGGDWMRPEVEVTLQWEPRDPAINARLDLEQTVELIQRLIWVQECTCDVVLMADDEPLVSHGTVPGGGLWPLHAYFAKPEGLIDSLQLILRHHSYKVEPFSTTFRRPREPDTAVPVGPFPFRLNQIAPSSFPLDIQRDMPEVQPTRLANARYTRSGVVPENVTKLVFTGEPLAIEELPRLRVTNAQLTGGDVKTHAFAAWIGLSEKPDVPPHLYVWLPTSPDDLPPTWELSIEGEYLRVDPEVAEERIFDLPVPASGL
jgi:hypothetical protein